MILKSYIIIRREPCHREIKKKDTKTNNNKCQHSKLKISHTDAIKKKSKMFRNDKQLLIYVMWHPSCYSEQ
jgi:hypothetical protein